MERMEMIKETKVISENIQSPAQGLEAYHIGSRCCYTLKNITRRNLLNMKRTLNPLKKNKYEYPVE